MKKIIRISLLLIAIVMVASCNKKSASGGNEGYKRTSLFISDETLLEGENIVFTGILTDEQSTPLADKEIRIVIKKVRTVLGVTGMNGLATIPTEPIPAGIYPCRGFFDGDDLYYSSYYDFTLTIHAQNN